MTTTTHTYKAEALLEWWDTRSGAEVMAEVETVVALIGGKVEEMPSKEWLAHTPQSDRYNGEGELAFGFAHNVDMTTPQGEAMRYVLRNALQSVCRLKYLNVDMNGAMSWDIDED